jgi:hypothetical protein
MRPASNLYDKVVPYLSPQAQEAYDQMVALGFDSDLSLAVLERICAPASIYELEDDESE